jgi:putative DNA primase/helicase
MNIAARIDFAALMQPVVARLLGEPNARLSKPPRDVRFGNCGSLAVNFEKGTFFDHENNVGGGTLDLIAHKTGRSHTESVAWLKQERLLLSPLPSPRFQSPIVRTGNEKLGRLVKAYPYENERGELLFEAVRFEPKDFRARRRGPAGDWIWDLKGVARVLYRLPELIAAVRDGHTVCICEGEKDADNICARLGYAATTCPGGAGKWDNLYNESLRGADVVLLPDNDDAGRRHTEKIAAALQGIAARVRVLDLTLIWAECPQKGDISDWLSAGGTAEKFKGLIDAAPDWTPPPPPRSRLRPLTLAELFALTIKPREMILDPIIPEKGLAMLYAVRGTGKTHVALGICFAVATGTNFLKWSAPKPRRVLLVDGEMPAAALQERLASIVASTPNIEPDPENIRILAGDLIEQGGIGNLASVEVQAELEPWLDGVDLLVIDNLSSLTAVIRDNDAESWGPIQEWLLRLRRRGVSVLIVHHAGKAGQQRGTSRREDVLDTSISLRRPTDYNPTEGARFEVHLEKARGVLGEHAKPFEAKLETRNGAVVWTTRDIEDANQARVRALLDDGLSIRDIADETGIPRSTVHRIKKAAEAENGGDRGGE